MSRIPTDTFLGMMRLNALTTRKVSVMQCTTIPFTLVRADESYILDVDQIFMEAAQLTDGRKPRGCRYSLALLITVAVLAKLAGFVRMEEIADWAKLRADAFQHFFALKWARMPHHATWSRVLGRAVTVEALDAFVHRVKAPPDTAEVPARAANQRPTHDTGDQARAYVLG